MSDELESVLNSDLGLREAVKTGTISVETVLEGFYTGRLQSEDLKAWCTRRKNSGVSVKTPKKNKKKKKGDKDADV